MNDCLRATEKEKPILNNQCRQTPRLWLYLHLFLSVFPSTTNSIGPHATADLHICGEKQLSRVLNFYLNFRLSKLSERSERGLGSEENCGCVSLIDSEMAGRIGLKLGRMIEDIAENVLAKEFFGFVEVDRGQVSGPQVPLLGHGDD